MEIRVRPAQVGDAPGLSVIDRLCTQGTSLVYHYQRDDFFARSRVYDKWTVFVAETGDTLVGMTAACVKKIYISGRYVPAGYIYDLRIHPAWRGQGISYRLLEQVEDYLRNEKVEYAYTYVLGMNDRAKKVSKTMSMHFAGEYKALIFPCFKEPDLKVELIRKLELQKVLPAIESGLAHYDLREKLPVSVLYREPFPGSPFLGTFRLSGSWNTTAGVWDSSVLSSKVIDRVPPAILALNKIAGWFRKRLKVPYMPGPGEKLLIWHLIDIRQETSKPEELKDIVREMQGLAGNRGVHLLMIHLDVKDTLFAILKKKAILSLQGRVLMRTPLAGELPPVLDCIYLDVRDF